MKELNDIQKKALQQFDEFAEKEGLSANKAAERIGVSSAVISLIKNGTYAGNAGN
ncbi:MAG: hypothetical protein HFE79_04595 [Ruminiclostridium sp.]|nr:hypothetical protein [Ruminiclostridium sp.]